MINQLPPLNPLKAFEAAARCQSLTAAAKELNVSQVAVSRQVKVLEGYLGVALFTRGHRGIALTREGRELQEGVTTAFREIAAAARRVSRRGRRDLLSIQSYTTFSQRWLIPRLANFHEEHPNIEVRLSSSTAPVDFDAQNLDAAIRSGSGDWLGLVSERLAEIELIPVCTPAFAKSHKLLRPADLARTRLLHSMARPQDWADWLAHAGVNADASGGVKFENSALAYEAATMEVGIAIGTKVFVQPLIDKGVLVAPFDISLLLDEGYYLTWPDSAPVSGPLLKFLAWIRAQMAEPKGV